MDVITCHINADFDCLSSMVGIKKLYPSAALVFPGSQEKKVRDFLEIYPIEFKRFKEIEQGDVSRLILVDTKKPDRIGPFGELLRERKDINVHIYDHHPFTDGDVRGVVEIIEDVGATSTIITEILKERKITIDPMEATILSLGIYEETGSMRFPSTTERDLKAVAYLIRRGANLNIISEFIKAEISRTELDLLNELVESSKHLVIGGVRISLHEAVREEYIGDVAHLAHRIIEMEEIDACILILSMEGKIVLIGRSRVPEFNTAEFMERFGGGGHPVAASATLKEEPLELVRDRVIEVVKAVVRPQKVAANIMTRPVITIPWKATMKEVESKLTRSGVNVLPVLKDDRYIGVISRENVEKALYHGFHDSKVIEFMTTDAAVAEPENSIREVEAQMIEQNQRFMPVVKEGKIIGAITRTDLLRNLYEDFLKRSRIKKKEVEDRPSVGRNITAMMTERFPGYLNDILTVAGETAEQNDFTAYLVGGSVRDLLMGQTNLDIDIVIEGDGIEFTRKLVERYPAKVKTHKRFVTAKITFPPFGDLEKELTVDVATARTEYYDEPAALPKVETSSIKKDLYRRDFTINALAVKLNPDGFGNLIDFFGGQRDIRDKVVRVLHNLSFVEDPTRAFRAVRFSERFGFRISKHTENLIQSALKLNLFDKLSGSRLYDELLLTFNETSPALALKHLARYKLLGVIHPNLKFTKHLEKVLNDVHETLVWYDLLFLGGRPDRAQIYLMALVTELDARDVESALSRLSTPEREKVKTLDNIEKAHRTMKFLFKDDPVDIYRTLHGLNIETLLYTMAICKDNRGQKAISKYLIEMTHIRPEIKGGDLKKLSLTPGPLYSEIFQKVLEEKLRGGLVTKEEEIEFVKKHYKKSKVKAEGKAEGKRKKKSKGKKESKAKAKKKTRVDVKKKVKAKATAKTKKKNVVKIKANTKRKTS
jgi:tRNA nucleotidyltransferase (CCA-adding enzyme)